MQMLNSHTHCQAAQGNRTIIQSLSKSVSEPTQKEEKINHYGLEIHSFKQKNEILSQYYFSIQLPFSEFGLPL